jgi:hypothetical protein
MCDELRPGARGARVAGTTHELPVFDGAVVIADASSVSYVAGWARADREVITQAATNVLRAVNTIAAALGLDADDERDEDGSETAGEEVSAA